jgi:cobalt-zinc-cadmium efflux system protein
MTDRHNHSSGARQKALWLALGANAGLMVTEVAGGLLFGSLALLADAAHMLSDVLALAIALLALRLAERPTSARHTYGLQRAEVVGAQSNALVLLLVVGWIGYNAIKRLGDAPEVEGAGVLVVALAGLAVNAVSAVVLRRSQGRSLNMRGAFLHMVSDALGSVAALAAGAAVVLWDAQWVDPAASLAISVLVAVSAWRLLRSATHVLLEGAPEGLDVEQVEQAVQREPHVEAIHHMHVWSIGSEMPALSVHIVVGHELSLHEAQALGDRLKEMLRERFGIVHATLELECHSCRSTEPTMQAPGAGVT